MSSPLKKTDVALIGVGFIPVVASIAGPALGLNEAFYWIASLLIWGWFAFVVSVHLRRSATADGASKLIQENEQLRKELEAATKSSDSDADIYLIKRTAESDFRKARGEIEGQVAQLKSVIDERSREIEVLKGALTSSKDQCNRAAEDLAKTKAEIMAFKDKPSSERSALELRIKEVEQMMSERDEEIAAQNALLKRILDLVPSIESQLRNVITATEGSAIEIGDKVRYIYDKAQEHLAESNEISKQFSGGSNHDSSFDGKSLSSVLNSSLSLLRDMTNMLNENSELNVEYSHSIEAILENTATINKITEDIQYISDLTNLLALNAAIEAARAGEHGRGFSVVAEEVRKLSDRTNQASNDITQIVGKVNDSVQAISNSLTANLEKTQNKKDAVDHAVGTLMNSARASTEVFSKLVEGSVVSSESVAHNIDQIILSLQFQDITKQEIEAAVLPLSQIRDLAGQMVSRLHTAPAGMEHSPARATTAPAKKSPAPLPPVKAKAAPAPAPATKAAVDDTGLWPSETPKASAPAQAAPAKAAPKPAEKAAEKPKEEGDLEAAHSGDVLFF